MDNTEPLIEVSLTPEQKAEADFNLKMADQKKSELHMAATITCVAAAARLQALEMRRYPASGDDLWKPLEDADYAEYEMLRRWWENWDADKKVRIALVTKQLAEGVEKMARIF